MPELFGSGEREKRLEDVDSFQLVGMKIQVDGKSSYRPSATTASPQLGASDAVLGRAAAARGAGRVATILSERVLAVPWAFVVINHLARRAAAGPEQFQLQDCA